jgi:hypothetical protein
MQPKSIIIFIVAVAVSTQAASYRFHDSAHAMGTLKKGGGVTRHPPQLDGQKESTSLIVTAKVVPPFRGDARVVLEEAPGYSYVVHNSEPAIKLPFHHRPAFQDNVYHDLRPNDRVALWVVMKKKAQLPVAQQHKGNDAEPSCCPLGPESQDVAPAKLGQRPKVKGPMLAFYDTRSNERLLAVPIRFTGTEGGRHGE